MAQTVAEALTDPMDQTGIQEAQRAYAHAMYQAVMIEARDLREAAQDALTHNSEGRVGQVLRLIAEADDAELFSLVALLP